MFIYAHIHTPHKRKRKLHEVKEGREAKGGRNSSFPAISFPSTCATQFSLKRRSRPGKSWENRKRNGDSEREREPPFQSSLCCCLAVWWSSQANGLCHQKKADGGRSCELFTFLPSNWRHAKKKRSLGVVRFLVQWCQSYEPMSLWTTDRQTLWVAVLLSFSAKHKRETHCHRFEKKQTRHVTIKRGINLEESRGNGTTTASLRQPIEKDDDAGNTSSMGWPRSPRDTVAAKQRDTPLSSLGQRLSHTANNHMTQSFEFSHNWRRFSQEEWPRVKMWLGKESGNTSSKKAYLFIYRQRVRVVEESRRLDGSGANGHRKPIRTILSHAISSRFPHLRMSLPKASFYTHVRKRKKHDSKPTVHQWLFQQISWLPIFKAFPHVPCLLFQIGKKKTRNGIDSLKYSTSLHNWHPSDLLYPTNASYRAR